MPGLMIPWNLQRATIVIVTAVANVAINGIIVAAPGANLITRIWGWNCLRYDTAEASAANWYAQLLNNAVTIMYTECSGSDFRSNGYFIPGGIRTTTNDAVRALMQSNVVGMNMQVMIYYTTEDA